MFNFQKEGERNGLSNSHSMSKLILFFFAIQSFGPKFKFQSTDISSNFILYFSGTISFARWSVLCKNSILWGEKKIRKSWERLLCPPPSLACWLTIERAGKKRKVPFLHKHFLLNHKLLCWPQIFEFIFSLKWKIHWWIVVNRKLFCNTCFPQCFETRFSNARTPDKSWNFRCCIITILVVTHNLK